MGDCAQCVHTTEGLAALCKELQVEGQLGWGHSGFRGQLRWNLTSLTMGGLR